MSQVVNCNYLKIENQCNNCEKYHQDNYSCFINLDIDLISRNISITITDSDLIIKYLLKLNLTWDAYCISAVNYLYPGLENKTIEKIKLLK